MIDPILQEKINVWRRKCVDQTISEDELKDAIIAMRQARRTAGEANAKSKSGGRAKKPVKDADTMLDELEKL